MWFCCSNSSIQSWGRRLTRDVIIMLPAWGLDHEGSRIDMLLGHTVSAMTLTIHSVVSNFRCCKWKQKLGHSWPARSRGLDPQATIVLTSVIFTNLMRKYWSNGFPSLPVAVVYYISHGEKYMVYFEFPRQQFMAMPLAQMHCVLVRCFLYDCIMQVQVKTAGERKW